MPSPFFMGHGGFQGYGANGWWHYTPIIIPANGGPLRAVSFFWGASSVAGDTVRIAVYKGGAAIDDTTGATLIEDFGIQTAAGSVGAVYLPLTTPESVSEGDIVWIAVMSEESAGSTYLQAPSSVGLGDFEGGRRVFADTPTTTVAPATLGGPYSATSITPRGGIVLDYPAGYRIWVGQNAGNRLAVGETITNTAPSLFVDFTTPALSDMADGDIGTIYWHGGTSNSLANGVGRGFRLRRSGSDLLLEGFLAVTNSPQFTLTSAMTVQPETRYRAVLTYNDTLPRPFILYVDTYANSFANLAQPGTQNWSGSWNAVLGAMWHNSTWDWPFTGKVHEAAQWINLQLPQADIEHLLNNERTPALLLNKPNVWWQFANGLLIGDIISVASAPKDLTLNGTVDYATTDTSALTITDADTDEILRFDQTDVPVTGTEMGTDETERTFHLVQGDIEIAQTETGTGTPTAAVLTIVGETAETDLKFGPATLRVTRTDEATASIAVVIVPPTGQIYCELASIYPIFDKRITAVADLTIGDQLQARGVGGGAVPAGLSLLDDGAASFADGETPAAFDARAWSLASQAWGAWSTQAADFEVSQDLSDVIEFSESHDIESAFNRDDTSSIFENLADAFAKLMTNDIISMSEVFDYSLPVTENLAPDALLDQTGLTGAVTAIDEDPDSPDGDWLTAPGSNTNTVCRTSFPTPTGTLVTGAGEQTFKAWVRKTNHSTNPTCVVQLYENGSLISTVVASTTISSTTGQMLTGTWDATGRTAANIECRVAGTVGGGGAGNRASVEVGAIRWVAKTQ